MAGCKHCGHPLPTDSGAGLHSWCYRHVRWGEQIPEMVACGPQCNHAPGADHGVYLYSAGTRTIMARVNGFYPKGAGESAVTSRWDD